MIHFYSIRTLFKGCNNSINELDKDNRNKIKLNIREDMIKYKGKDKLEYIL